MAHRVLVGVIEAIAAAEGVDPARLDTVLEDCIDTDALRQLADHDANSWTLSFEFSDHRVGVAGDGWVLVDGDRTTRWRAAHDRDADGPERVLG